MRRRNAALLTRFYSRSWRERYGTEFQALLQELPLTPAVVADVLFNAIGTRKPVFAMLCVFALAAVSLSLFEVRSQTRMHDAVSVKPHAKVVADCSLYSSISNTQFVTGRKCLT